MTELGLDPAEARTPVAPGAAGGRPRGVGAPAAWRAYQLAPKRLSETFEREIDAGRGALWLPVIFGAGILAYAALPSEPSHSGLIALCVAASGAAILARNTLWRFRALLMLAVLLAGASAIALRTSAIATPMLDRDWTGQFSGWVETVEPISAGSRRLTLRVASMEDFATDRMPVRVRVTVRGTMTRPRPGDALAGLVSLQAARGPILPGGFDFDRAAFYAGIGASGFSYGVLKPADIRPAPFSIRIARPLAILRSVIGARIEAALPGVRGEIANALVTGERGGIPDDVEQALRDSGLYHIISISGLHMALVAAAAFGAIRGTLALFPAVALRRPIKKWAAAGALAVTTLYLLLSGAEVATQRSYIMLAIVLIAVLLDRRAFSLRNVALAALLVLVLQPEALFSASFQMSFAATLGLAAGFEAITAWRNRDEAGPRPARNRITRFVARWFLFALATSVLAGLATAPFSAYHFQRTAPLSLVANMAADPAVALFVMPPALLAVAMMPFGLEAAPLWVMDQGLRIVLAVADTVARWSGSSGLVPMFSAPALLFMIAGFLWLCLWRERWRLAGLVPILIGVALAATVERPAVIVSPDGEAAAVRAADGRYQILSPVRASFETEIWLRSDADPRPVNDRSLRAGVHCDPLGCTSLAADGTRVALVLRPEAFDEDCQLAAIVISAFNAPAGCAAGTVIDGRILRAGGAAALYPRTSVVNEEESPLRFVSALPELRRPGLPPRPPEPR